MVGWNQLIFLSEVGAGSYIMYEKKLGMWFFNRCDDCSRCGLSVVFIPYSQGFFMILAYNIDSSLKVFQTVKVMV